jgi:hypothetical protein
MPGLYLDSLVRGGNRFSFLHLHILAAADKLTIAGFGAKCLSAAFLAAISFTQLACHFLTS